MRKKQIHFLQQVLTKEEYEEVIAHEDTFEEALKLYNEETIANSFILAIQDSRFLLSQKDIERFPGNWIMTLKELAEKEELVNPIYVGVDEEGILIIE